MTEYKCNTCDVTQDSKQRGLTAACAAYADGQGCVCWRPVPDTKQGSGMQTADASAGSKDLNSDTTGAAQAYMHKDTEGGNPAMGTGGRVGTSFSESLFGGDETLNLDLIIHIIHECSDNTKIIEGILRSCTDLLKVYCPEVATKQLQCNYCQDCCPYCRCCCPPLVQILDKMPEQDKIADSPAPEKETPILPENFLRVISEIGRGREIEKVTVHVKFKSMIDVLKEHVAQMDNGNNISNKEE